jgi:glutamyl-tRNA synthetase
VSLPPASSLPYRGRLAPSPTGHLHLGHARTFWTAQERARAAGGTLIFRNEDLDPDRCRPEFVTAMLEDLRWFGLRWEEGPDVGGPCGPYTQSERRAHYLEAFRRLRAGGFLYPCRCSRRDVQRALGAPHAGEDEPVYPGTCRPAAGEEGFRVPPELVWEPGEQARREVAGAERRVNWRFRVPEGERVGFLDGAAGPQVFVAGRDFGDFIVWRHDDVPAYHLAVTVDDALMGITEVVRGADLVPSTARQLLLYRALGWGAPRFWHCPLMTDERGVRLAKRHDALSLRALRGQGATPEGLRREHFR